MFKFQVQLATTFPGFSHGQHAYGLAVRDYLRFIDVEFQDSDEFFKWSDHGDRYGSAWIDISEDDARSMPEWFSDRTSWTLVLPESVGRSIGFRLELSPIDGYPAGTSRFIRPVKPDDPSEFIRLAKAMYAVAHNQELVQACGWELADQDN